MFEKKLPAVSAQLLQANGGSDGTAMVPDSTLFKVKQKVTFFSDNVSPIICEVKRILTGSAIQVGRTGQPITDRTNLSSLLTSDNAKVSADEQNRVAISQEDVMRAVYDEEPTVALRSALVDELGQRYSDNNPLPVNATVTVGGGTIPVDWTEIDLAYDGNKNLQQVKYYKNATLQETIDVTVDTDGDIIKVQGS